MKRAVLFALASLLVAGCDRVEEQRTGGRGTDYNLAVERRTGLFGDSTQVALYGPNGRERISILRAKAEVQAVWAGPDAVAVCAPEGVDVPATVKTAGTVRGPETFRILRVCPAAAN